MALGTFRFGVNRASYQMFTRDAAYRWAKQDRLGRDPALQYLGPDAEEITLEGVIYPHFKGGLRQMELMRAVARQGVPMMLVDGLGFVWQRWVITRVSETKSLFLADGAPRRIEFNVTLRAYGSDRA
ncbi:MAG: phage tail protein [Rhodobacter sp.]|nr:phage tail protein [Rhodobacter sp.]MCA3462259.1 phage tail protein [Rhodobacter sp.]MCA3462756.1 phage tail protein [Rhodobacter sp.]MCA3468105.1 phage tail protein [Rhodobacter sp.]MCA3472298.1 phage tail protein [Rhodobacter sp.]